MHPDDKFALSVISTLVALMILLVAFIARVYPEHIQFTLLTIAVGAIAGLIATAAMNRS